MANSLPGRPGVTYDHVSTAANELAARGDRPTSRAIRDELGRGSLATIQRHLETWRTSRRRKHVDNPFSISARDVENLAPLDFATLIGGLVRSEARRQRLDATVRTTQRIDEADNGIDGTITWAGGPPQTRHLPARTLAWQAKSGRRPAASELVREIERRNGDGLKSGIREILETGGAYVLFCAADMPANQQSVRIAQMRAAARRHLPNLEPVVAFVAGEEIAAWASEDLWARAFLLRAAGRDHPSLLRTFEEWERIPGLDNPYVWSDSATEIAASVRRAMYSPAAMYRLEGAPGLGKTRLALEALRPLHEAGLGVAYFNARYIGTGVDLLRALPMWRRQEVGGILVVDDCDLELHNQIAREVAGTQMCVLTIDYRHDSIANGTLRSVTDDVIEQLIRSHPKAPSEFNVRRIVEYSQGWPLMAILVLSAISAGKERIADLDDDELTIRLVKSDEEHAERIIRVLALFDHVGYQGDVAHEWETVRNTLTPDIPPDAFYRVARSYEKRGIITTIGRFWRVTPPPLALRLIQAWLESAIPETQERLFSTLPEALTEALAQRFHDIGTETAVLTADRLLGPNGRFGTAEGFLGRTNAEIFYALAEISPRSAAATLRRAFLRLTDADIHSIDEESGRQTLVFALECIAFHNDCFEDAARVLFALARNENASNGNNSSGTLIKLFGVVGSQTEAPPAARIRILDEMLARDDGPSLMLAGAALERIFSNQPGYVRVGPESQGGRAPLIEWRPSTWNEVFSYYGAATDRVLVLANKSDMGFELARKAATTSILSLIRHRRWNEIERILRRLRGRVWPEAVERLTWTLRYELKNADSADRDRTENLLSLLAPDTLHDRISIYVSNPPHDLEDRSGTVVDVSAERLISFAEETVRSNEIADVLKVISTGSHRLSFDYGVAIARLSPDITSLTSVALIALKEAQEPRSPHALMGVLMVLGDRQPNLRRDILDLVSSDAALISHLPLLSSQPRFDNEDVDRLIRSCSTGQLDTPPPPSSFMGKSLRNVSEDRLRKLADLYIRHGWHAAAISMLTYGIDSDTTSFDDLFAMIALQSEFVTTPMADVYEWSLLQIIRRIIDGGNIPFSKAIATQMIDLSLSKRGFAAKRRLSDLWPHLLKQDAVWNQVCERFARLDRRDRWKVLNGFQYLPNGTIEHRLALEDIALSQLWLFAANFPDDVPSFLASNGTIVEADSGGRLIITPLMSGLLERFGERDDVLRNLDSNLHSFLSVGPRAGYYEEREALTENIPSFGKAKIAAWKEDVRAHLNAERQRARADDAEHAGGIF